MVFLACHMPSWGVLKKIPHDARFTFEQINQMLCLQFDLALAVKEGVRRELVKQAETDIRTVLHESIAKMPGVDIHRTRPSDCDICGIIEVVKRMARSQCVKECKRFMLSTLDEPRDRIGYDWNPAFDEYHKSAGLTADHGFGKRVARATMLMTTMQAAAKTEAPAMRNSTSDPDSDDDIPTIQQMVARTNQVLDILRCRHLKITPYMETP